jgi:hypothetical protein
MMDQKRLGLIEAAQAASALIVVKPVQAFKLGQRRDGKMKVLGGMTDQELWRRSCFLESATLVASIWSRLGHLTKSRLVWDMFAS